jgi:hypothetical protein
MPEHGQRFKFSSLVLSASCILFHTQAQGQNYIEVNPYDSSVRALKNATSPARDGSNHKILMALRQLEDPDLAPLFQDLLDSSEPLLRIDALLALNELEREEGIELTPILARFNQRERLISISALIDLDLLKLDQAQILLKLEGLSDVERLMLVGHIISLKNDDEQAAQIRPLTQDEDPATRMIASLLLAEIGEGDYLNTELLAFQNLDTQTKVLVGTAVIDFSDWHPNKEGLPLLSHATADKNFVRSLRLAAADAALACECPEGLAIWKTACENSQAAGDRSRLATAAFDRGLRTPDWTAIRDGRLLNERLADAGEAFGKGTELLPHAKNLLAVKHPLSLQAVLALAEHCPPETSEAIWMMVLSQALQDPRLQPSAGRVVTRMADNRSPELQGMLRRIARSDQKILAEFALIGLMNSSNDSAKTDAVLFAENPNTNIQSIAMIIRALSDEVMTDKQMKELQTIASGGGRVAPSIRAIAAWAWLERSGNSDRAIQELITSN